MKTLNDFIIEKILINKNTEVPVSIDFNSATKKFTTVLEFRKYIKSIFDTNINSFIASFIDHSKPIYMWKVEKGDETWHNLDEMIKTHRKYHNISNEDIKVAKNDSISSNEYTCLITVYKNHDNYTEIYVINRNKYDHMYFIIQS